MGNITVNIEYAPPPCKGFPVKHFSRTGNYSFL